MSIIGWIIYNDASLGIDGIRSCYKATNNFTSVHNEVKIVFGLVVGSYIEGAGVFRRQLVLYIVKSEPELVGRTRLRIHNEIHYFNGAFADYSKLLGWGGWNTTATWYCLQSSDLMYWALFGKQKTLRQFNDYFWTVEEIMAWSEIYIDQACKLDCRDERIRFDFIYFTR